MQQRVFTPLFARDFIDPRFPLREFSQQLDRLLAKPRLESAALNALDAHSG